MADGVDVEAFKAGPIQELDQIRQIDRQLHDPNITLQERQDAETRSAGLISGLSERFGVPQEIVVDQLGRERQLQEVADRAAKTLTDTQRQFDTLVRVGASPETITRAMNDIKSPKSGVSGISVSAPTQTGK